MFKGILEKSEEQLKVRVLEHNGQKGEPGATPSHSLPNPIFMTLAGLSDGYKDGDRVIVGYEKGDISKPIVMGKFIDSAEGGIKASHLTVNGKAELSSDTTIGKISYGNLSHLSGLKQNVQEGLKELKKATESSAKRGRVIFDKPNGMQEAIISVQIGKRYEVYLNSRFESPDTRRGRQIVSVVAPPNPNNLNYSDNFRVPVFVVKTINQTTGETGNFPAYVSFFGSLAEKPIKSITVYYHNTYPENAQEELYIYKIIEYDEV